MKIQKHAAYLTLAGSLALVVGCSSQPKEAKQETMVNTARATAEVGGSQYVVIDFAKGTKSLDDTDREKLRNLASQAPHRGKIAEYEVLAWADREYPAQGQKATTQESDLAEERADSIKDYLKKDLRTTESVKSHNMARRPGSLAEMFKTEDYKTKKTFEGTGAAPSDHATAINKIENKASKAVIFVRYE